MPRTRLQQHVKELKNPRQPILEMINGRFDTCSITIEELAEGMGLCRAAAYKRLKQPIEQWTYGELIGACRVLLITTDELCEKVKI